MIPRYDLENFRFVRHIFMLVSLRISDCYKSERLISSSSTLSTTKSTNTTIKLSAAKMTSATSEDTTMPFAIADETELRQNMINDQFYSTNTKMSSIKAHQSLHQDKNSISQSLCSHFSTVHLESTVLILFDLDSRYGPFSGSTV